MFGMCARAVNTATADWTISATCPQTDGAYWNGIPTTTAGGNSKIAHTTSTGVTNATVSFRYGLRAPASQKSGAYMALINFDVIAPNA